MKIDLNDPQMQKDIELFIKLEKKKYDKWLKTGLLEGLDEKFPNQDASNIVAIMLENQAQQMIKTDCNKEYNNYSLLVVRRVMEALLQFQKDSQYNIEIKPMKLPAGLIFWEEGGEYKSRAITTNSRHSRAVMAYRDANCMNKMDEEACIVAKFSQDLFDDIKSEIEDDLKNLKDDQKYFYCPYVLMIPMKMPDAEPDRFSMRYAKQVV